MNVLLSRTDIDLACEQLRARGVVAPQVALVLGSGLGGFSRQFQEPIVVGYGDVRGMPTSSVAGHAGQFVSGRVAGVPALAMQGRVHLYEGHGADAVVHGVRVMCALGASVLIVTNAAGGIGTELRAGSLMLIDDHLNLTGRNCLMGPNDETLGPRFPDLSFAYDRALLETAERVGVSRHIPLTRGVYAGVLGPSYETPAEVRMLRGLGADAVGMSTVLEVIAARHMGVRCLGVSCVTNLAAGLGEETLSHEDVQQVAASAASRLEALILGVIEAIGAQS